MPSWSSCPFCKRFIGLTRNDVFYRHMPYERRSQAFFLDRGRPCLGSGKTLAEADTAFEEWRRKVAEFFARG